MPSKFSDLWRYTNLIIAEIEKWIAHNDDKHVRLRFNQLDQARLLKLRVWSYRHKIDICEVLDMIIPPLRTVISKMKNSYGLGITIRAMTSQRAYKILVSRLKEAYPQDEHIDVWRENERDRQLQIEANYKNGGLISRSPQMSNSVLDSPNAKEFARRYTKIAIMKRERHQTLCGQSWRKRRRYRYSPWI